jgi:hypothetical protein
MPSSRSFLAAAVLLLGFAAGFWLLRRPPVEPIPVAAPVPAAATPEAVIAVAVDAAPSPSASPRRTTIRTETEIAPTLEEPQMRSITAGAADDYRRRARFPRSSQPIEDGVDPIQRDREVTRGKSVGPEGTNPTLVLWPERTGFEAPSPIVIFACLVHDEHKVEPKTMRGEIRTQQGGVLAALAFTDDGRNGDAQANDLVYTAVVAPGREHALDFKGAQLIEARAETRGGEERIATSGFLYSVPLAHLTGRYRDEIVDGNLVVSAEVQVDADARFHLEATLAESDGTPLGWAQNAAVLGPGTEWMPLTYWGLMLRERGANGPYVLLSVALSTTGEMPNQKNDVVVNAHITKPYDVTQFSDRAFQDPDLLEQAARLQADAPPGGGNLQADPGR